MSKRTSNDMPEIYERLRHSPVPQPRVPSYERIKMIQNRVAESEHRCGRRRLFIAAGAISACLALFFTLAFVYEIPGGIADQRISHASGLKDTLRIPLGRTPEEAVEKYRGSPIKQIIHRERIKEGMLLFIKQDDQSDNTGLQVEYVRKSWLGWKWVWGGGYGIGRDLSSMPALNYMAMPYFEGGVRAPFPIVFGEILDTSVYEVIVSSGENSIEKSKAIITGDKTNYRIWFALLPPSASAPYSIDAFNSTGDIVAHKTFNDSRDIGIVPLLDKKISNSKDWILSPLFEVSSTDHEGKEITSTLRGIKNKIGITDAPLIVGISQKVLWHFWGDPDELHGELTIKGSSQSSEQTHILFESKIAKGASVRGATTSIPSGIALSETGLWKLEVYINGILFDSIIVEGKDSW